MFSGEAAWGCPLSFSLLASFSPSLPLSPSLVLSLTFLFNYLMSPLLAQTPIERWAAPSALNRLCTSDLWSFLCLTVCASLSVPITNVCIWMQNLSVLVWIWWFLQALLKAFPRMFVFELFRPVYETECWLKRQILGIKWVTKAINNTDRVDFCMYKDTSSSNWGCN